MGIRSTALTVLSCILFSSSATFANSSTDNPPTCQASSTQGPSFALVAKPKKDQPEYLFVIEAKHATLTHDHDKTFTLTIPLTDIKSVLMFSDRPYRVAHRMQPSTYAFIIHNGPDSFDKNPPNMALAWGHQLSPTSAYIISSYKKDSSNIIYTLKLLGDETVNKSTISGHVALFIDDANADCLSSCYTGGKPSTAKFSEILSCGGYCSSNS